MMYNNQWRMEESQAQEKVLTVDEGAREICRVCWNCVKTVYEADEDGNTFGTGAERIDGVFEELIVPASVVKVNDFAFVDHAALKKISVLENVTYIGKNAFKGCDGLAFVAAPKVSLSSVADTEGKLKLAMGYLLHKDLYEADIAAEYDAYIKKQKKKLLPIAQKHGLTEAEEVLAAAIAGK